MLSNTFDTNNDSDVKSYESEQAAPVKNAEGLHPGYESGRRGMTKKEECAAKHVVRRENEMVRKTKEKREWKRSLHSSEAPSGLLGQILSIPRSAPRRHLSTCTRADSEPQHNLPLRLAPDT